ncbi:NAD(P)-binding protein [Lophiostoma macrostomum CBS 122681]|uniref:NAD(P)-binding protein n=1 Tax=Lophiostoma macrostomum CBS 122681 TaxID=1314788 RepID=A0A6A6T2E4_9PLEO|nr:NAD(P)-binding protein [Lophiostoma macrostomum CBS 122681]
MTTAKIYLITGANRGIGRGFTASLLQRPSTTVIAAVRDPSHPTAKALTALPAAHNSGLILIRLDSSDETSAQEAVQSLKEDHSVSHIDVVIANAGIGTGGGTVRNTTTDNIKQHVLVNTIGPIVLFQATADLLQASPTKQPIFVAVSTLIGSLATMDALADLGFPSTFSPYGGSKAALNWFVRRLHFEEPWLTSFVFHPGLVETDMSAQSFDGSGLHPKNLGAISVDTSVSGMVSVIDKATRETLSGTFKNYDGTNLPW